MFKKDPVNYTFKKVVCSWGRKGLSMAWVFSNRMAKVSRTAVFTLYTNLSPRILKRKYKARIEFEHGLGLLQQDGQSV